MAFLRTSLPRLIAQLKRTGKAGDEGIDLTGQLEPSGRLVIVQCKSLKPVVGPATLRELEGTLVRQTQRSPIGLLFGASGFAPATCERCTTSALALVLLHLPPPLLPGESGDAAKRSQLQGILMSKSAQEALHPHLTIQRAMDTEGKLFVKLGEVT